MRAAVVMTVAAFLFVVPLSPVQGGEGKLAVGSDAPGFSCKLVDGTEEAMERLIRENRGVLIAFWGLRCAACIDEIPALEAIQKDYGGRSVQVLGVNVDGVQPAELREMMKEAKIETGYKIAADPEFRIADAYGLVGAPLTVLVGRDGKIKYIHTDYRAGDELEVRKLIESLVAN